MRQTTIALLVMLLAGCTTETEFGKCVGLGEDKDPKLVYKVSGWNVFLGIIGIEIIYPPIAVLVDSLFCPVAKR